MAFAFSRSLWVSLGLLFVIGFGMIVQMAASNTILQTIVDDDKRGRIMSLFTMAFMGMSPWGSLAAGGLASWIGIPATLFLSGVLCVGGAVVLVSRLSELRAFIRPIYIKRGIISEVASGIQTATALTSSTED